MESRRLLSCVVYRIDPHAAPRHQIMMKTERVYPCLLYTSDAADEEDSRRLKSCRSLQDSKLNFIL